MAAEGPPPPRTGFDLRIVQPVASVGKLTVSYSRLRLCFVVTVCLRLLCYSRLRLCFVVTVCLRLLCYSNITLLVDIYLLLICLFIYYLFVYYLFIYLFIYLSIYLFLIQLIVRQDKRFFSTREVRSVLKLPSLLLLRLKWPAFAVHRLPSHSVEFKKSM
jgi:hypothetical protein